MKKITLCAIVAIAALSMTSCKKDRTCTCTATSGGIGFTYTQTITKVTKKGAEQGICASGTETDSNGQVTTITCTVK